MRKSKFLRNMDSLPLITKSLFIVNVAIYVLIFISSTSLGLYAISYFLVVSQMEVYRILSSAFVHSGIFHIFMNMSSLFQLGMDLEKQFGSLQFLFLSLWFIAVNGLIYLALSWLTALVTGNSSYLYSSGVGYSGVLFSYAVLESFHTTATSRSVFGLFSVPAKVFPFILLVLIQILLPNISLFGHLAGCISGLLTVYGYLDNFFPSAEAYLRLEQYSVCGILTKRSDFVLHTTKNPSIAGNSGRLGLGGVVLIGLTYVWYFIETILHVCGIPTDRLKSCVSSSFQYLKFYFCRIFCCFRMCFGGSNDEQNPDNDPSHINLRIPGVRHPSIRARNSNERPNQASNNVADNKTMNPLRTPPVPTSSPTSSSPATSQGTSIVTPSGTYHSVPLEEDQSDSQV